MELWKIRVSKHVLLASAKRSSLKACTSTHGECFVSHRNFWHLMPKDFGNLNGRVERQRLANYYLIFHIAVRNRLSFLGKVTLI